MLRADRTGPYGADPDPTPELSRWAARGIVFERVLAQSSWTKISMASLLTSGDGRCLVPPHYPSN
jgi:arylsulfatase A-like enzyme